MRDDEPNAGLLETGAVLEWLADFGQALIHDLSQPLAAASNYLSAARQMARAEAPGPSLEQALDKAAAQITRASEGLRRLQAALNAGEPRFAEASLHALLRRTADRAERQNQARVALRLDARQDRVLVDGAQIEQALAILVERARRLGGRQLAITTESDKDSIRVQIVAAAAHALAPDSLYPAAGLAVALARAILEAHDAALEVTHGGSGVVVRVPLAA